MVLKLGRWRQENQKLVTFDYTVSSRSAWTDSASFYLKTKNRALGPLYPLPLCAAIIEFW